MLRELGSDLFGRAVDFLFPELCIVCDKPRSGREAWLCDHCIGKLTGNHAGRIPCPRCAMNRAKGACVCAGGWPHSFDYVFSIFDFDKTVQAALHQMKYRGKKRFARHFGTLFSRFVPDELFDGVDAVVPLPLHRRRERSRGYNQALFFAQGVIAGRTAAPIFERAIRRAKHTVSQTSLNRSKRTTNVKGAFVANPSEVAILKGKIVLLIDDVVTTGASTDAATRALLAGGCASVRVLSLARD
jgi:ComF family protein